MTNDLTLVLDAQASLGEGPIWDARQNLLWWVDITLKRLHAFTPESGANQTFELDQMIGTVVPRQRGGFVLAAEQGFLAFNPATGQANSIMDPEADRPETRFNDGKCDPAGRLWAGTMARDEAAGAGSLYCLDTDGSCTKKLGALTVANGIVWTADRSTMYYIDSPTRRIDAFDYDLATGAIGHRRTAVSIPEGMGYPDGMSIDAEDHLWVGLWGGWAVAHFDPRTGKLLSRIEVPSANVTACAFGGPTLQDLYITTARERCGDLADQPHAGGLFRARPGVRGVPSVAFGG